MQKRLEQPLWEEGPQKDYILTVKIFLKIKSYEILFFNEPWDRQIHLKNKSTVLVVQLAPPQKLW